MLACVVIAVLAWIGYRLREASRDPKTSQGDRVLLDLAFGLDAVVIWVLALDTSMGILV